MAKSKLCPHNRYFPVKDGHLMMIHCKDCERDVRFAELIKERAILIAASECTNEHIAIGPQALELLATGNARIKLNRPRGMYIALVEIGQVTYRGVGGTVELALDSLEKDITALRERMERGGYHKGDIYPKVMHETTGELIKVEEIK